MNDNINIYWIRQDLRLMDNPALTAAVNNGPIIPIYILDEKSPKEHKIGQSSRLWLHHSLIQLNRKFDNKLLIAKGNPEDILINICDLEGVNNIFWNRVYEPWSIIRDKQIKQNLSEKNIQVSTFNSSLLWEPWDVKKNDNTPYRVFTPYFRRGCLNAKTPRRPIRKPDNIIYHPINCFKPIQINDLNLQSDYKWKDNIIAQWSIGEDAAQKRLNEFVDNELDGYKEGRNFPTKKNVSRLSPYLHWGEISPNTVWYKVKDKNDLEVKNHQDTDHFLSEMGWREFSHSLLYYFPELPKKNLQKKFDKFSWNIDETKLKAWQRGKTGYPIVDAGMRELWLTGYMHNRLRMIVGSFLVKNLLLHWNEGEKWFWDCLVDADLANNSAGWQWIAGCGADAAPYFRIFNPITQGLKFDPNGEYVRKYIPEISKLPNKYLFNPWEAPYEELERANVTLGDTYPKPIVDLKISRQDALSAFAQLKENIV
ncbi:DNA photolyase family protein [Alphaproteobacteria bacterium]|nr:DNA photolyase family protein [Alphaproteobacteria bacterium]